MLTLWRINPDDPSDTAPPYGKEGSIFDEAVPSSDREVATAMTSYNGELYIATSDEIDLSPMLSLSRYDHQRTAWFTVTDIVVIASCSAGAFVLVMLGVL